MDFEKESFIQMAIDSNVLKWGEFTLRSGRVSPYFFNAGLFYSGAVLKKLGQFYADIFLKQKLSEKNLFGPAYKGLPLATSTAIALAERGTDVDVTFNRKEVKTHGEGGKLMGAPLKGKRVVMIDDVITAGTAFRESKALIEAAGGKLTAVLIALDREERGLSQQSTLDEIKAQGVQVFSVITLNDLIKYLEKKSEKNQLERVLAYKKYHGV